MTTNTNTLIGLGTLESLCLGMHQIIVIQNAPFDLAAFTNEMCESHMLLADADLDVYCLALMTLMTNGKRGIEGNMALTIYGHLRAMQDMVKQGQATR